LTLFVPGPKTKKLFAFFPRLSKQGRFSWLLQFGGPEFSVCIHAGRKNVLEKKKEAEDRRRKIEAVFWRKVVFNQTIAGPRIGSRGRFGYVFRFLKTQVWGGGTQAVTVNIRHWPSTFTWAGYR